MYFKYSLGLDIGIGSVGWAIIELDKTNKPLKIEAEGVRVFDTLEDKDGKLANADRRISRGQRRLIRRRAHRVSRVKYLLNYGLNVEYDSIGAQVLNNPYIIKVKGLKKELSKEELGAVLVHYAKNRGFKSNRKIEDAKMEKSKTDDGKLLSGIKNVENILNERDITVTEYLVEKFEEINQLRNSSTNFINTISRDMYKREIEKLLSKQEELGVITNEFKEKYMDIWSSQRDFSEGPGGDSKFGGSDMIDRRIGKCSFTGEARAPKAAPSSEIFVFLSKLNTIKIREGRDQGYRFLCSNEIEKIYNKALKVQAITYKAIAKELGYTDIGFKDLDLTKKEYIDALNAFKKSKNIDVIDDKNKSAFNEALNEKRLKKNFGSLKNYHSMKKVVSKACGEKYLSKIELDFELLDDISNCLLRGSTDRKIREYYKNKEIEECLLDAVLQMENVSQTIKLSLSLVRRLNPLLLKGFKYNEAMQEIGYDHSKTHGDIEVVQYLPPIHEILVEVNEHMTSANVKHTLTEARKVINKIIERYGKPYVINVEVARELAKSFNQRKEITFDQIDNMQVNESVKLELTNIYPHIFKNINRIKQNDVTKYKLYKEQNGICAYSFEPITGIELFNDNLVQVDHILPYSRTFDDSYSNKTLVKTKMNQLKGNRTPFEYFDKSSWSRFSQFILNNNQISFSKKQKYLAREIDKDFIERNLNDTKYASKFLLNILKLYLNPDGGVHAYSGSITSFLKKRWGLNIITHSLVSKDYRKDSDLVLEKINLTEDSIEIVVTNRSTDTYDASVKAKKKNNDGTLDELSSSILVVLSKRDMLTEVSERFKGHKLEIVYDKIVNDSINDSISLADEKYNISLAKVFNVLVANIKSKLLTKDRDNHLHHILDASILAAMNRSLQIMITKYMQYVDYLKSIGKTEIVDEETGELINITDYAEKHFILKSHRHKNDLFPVPYSDFVSEVIYRTFERDADTLRNNLLSLNTYKGKEEEVNHITPVYPSKANKKKVSGALHKDTFFGEKKGQITKRIDVTALDMKNVIKIFAKDEGAKDVFQAVLCWLDGKSGKDAFKTKGYPRLKNGREVKKVKIIESDDLSSRIKLGEKRYAAVDKANRIDIYKKEGDDRLYFVQMTNFYILKEQRGEEDFLVTVWWAQKKSIVLTYKELFDKFYLYKRVFPTDLVEITNRKRNDILAYVGGFTSGKLQIKSIIGDGIDLINEYKLFKKTEKQYRIDVATIKDVKIKQISVLGEVN